MSKAPSAPFHNCQKQTYEIGRIICARTVKVEANQIPTPQPSPRLTSLRPKPLLHHEIGDSGTELFIHNLRKISKKSGTCHEYPWMPAAYVDAFRLVAQLLQNEDLYICLSEQHFIKKESKVFKLEGLSI